MDELGVTGKDDTLCSDRWYSCTTYDRQQFDQKYPGQRLKDMLRFGEPDWPDRPRSGYGTRKSDRMDHGDRIATGWINTETARRSFYMVAISLTSEYWNESVVSQ